MDTEFEFHGQDALVQSLDQQCVPIDGVCIVGSMSLSARNIRMHNDVDVCIEKKYDDKISSKQLPSGMSISKNRYEPIGLSDDELIRNSDLHDISSTFKIVRPEITLSFKQYRNKPKDITDIQLIKEYRDNSDCWDEELYQSYGSGNSTTLFYRGICLLQNHGVVESSIRVASFLETRHPAVSKARNLFPKKEINTIRKTLSTEKHTASSAELLNQQYRQSEFTAMDVVLWYDVLIELASKKSQRSSEYQDIELINEEEINQIRDILNGRRNPSNNVKIDIKSRILNPNEFVSQIWHGLNVHELSISHRRTNPMTKKDLSNYGVPTSLIDILEKRRVELLENVGALFYSILWPPSKDHHDEIQSEFESEPNIKVHSSLNLSIDEFWAFVHEIYDVQQSKTSKKKIDDKIDTMREYGQTVRILSLELPDPKIMNANSIRLETIKTDIRRRYLSELSEELFYSILHTTDNFEDNIRTREVLESYDYNPNHSAIID